MKLLHLLITSTLVSTLSLTALGAVQRDLSFLPSAKEKPLVHSTGDVCKVGMGYEAKYTAKDYVQDGLIAMWDGIENAGWGQHSSSLTIQPLIGNLNIQATEVHDNNFIMNVQARFTSTNFDGYATIEFVSRNISGENSVFSTLSSGGSNFYGCDLISSVEVRFMKPNNSLLRLSIDPSQKIKSYSARYDGYNAYYRLDDNKYPSQSYSTQISGTQVFSIGKWTEWTGGSSCEYCSIRIYSKCLSDDEVNHNYLVDKARFNLP